jgi:predicted nucleotidyltransferase
MVEAGTTATLEDIQAVVRQIVQHFHPEKVVLFGSYSDGTPDGDSDVDLLVIMDTDEQLLQAAARIAALVDHPFPLDIIVFRPSEFRASLERKGVFATTVMTTGTVLYEAGDGRLD